MTAATALFGNGVKSIQRGTITIAAAESSNTATISSVDTNKAFVLYGGHTFSGTSSAFSSLAANVVLTNATTVTASRVGTNNDTILAYTVVEFY